MYILVVLFVLLWSAFIYVVLKDKRLLGFYLKGFTSFAFILVFAFGLYLLTIRFDTGITFESKELLFAILVFVGLVAGLIGDLFLELMHVDKTKDRTIIMGFGTLIFLIGHLFYISGMIVLEGFNYVSLLIGLGMTGVVYLGSRMMKLDMGKLTIISYIYSFVIFTMIGVSITSAFSSGFSTPMTVFMIGAIFFGISDLFLAPLYYGKVNKNSIVFLNLATYYLGQLLIALSIYYFL